MHDVSSQVGSTRSFSQGFVRGPRVVDALLLLLAVVGALWTGELPAAPILLSATDAGFVTEAGGSSKGDGTIAPGATFNYSVGFEVHYSAGALFTPLAPMFRKNYFVFDLSGIITPIGAAVLTLWSGTLESADSSEFYAIHDTADMPGAVGLATALGLATSSTEFDDVVDPLITASTSLYGKLAAGPATLASALITHAMDDAFITLTFTPGGVAYLNGFLGKTIILGGMVPSATPPAAPQQPFGFTGPDIAGGDPLTPVLMLTPLLLLPEPGTAAMLLSLLAAMALGKFGRRGR